MKSALMKILHNKSIDEELFWKHFKERVEEILKYEIQRISYHGKTGVNITDDLNLVATYYSFFDNNKLLVIISPIKILESIAGLNRLNDNLDSPVRGIYGSLFKCCSIKDINVSLADMIFDDLIHSYHRNYKWTDRDDTLEWIELIFEMLSDTKINTFSKLIEIEFKNSQFHTGTVADSMYRIFSKYESRFKEPDKDIVYSSAKYLYENGINDYVKNGARQFIEHIEKSKI